MTGQVAAINVPWRQVPNQPDHDASEVVPMLRRWSMAEVLSEPDDFSWLVQGMLCDPTYGQIAGEMKSLKTYVSAMIQVGLAGGVPILDRFVPSRPAPVVAYIGEGGRKPYVRRLKRIADAMGVDLASIPLQIVTDVAPIQSATFEASLDRDLRELEPALVFLDPFYAYHGTATRASDLHQEGSLLSGLSGRCLAGGASLMVVNHMNQTGTGMDLKRITMAGSGEWVDSWMLLARREDPNVEAGEFKLRLEIGSRQWGGTTWDLDLCVGRFNEETGSHDGDITWTLRKATGDNAARSRDDKDAATRLTIINTLSDKPGLTKTECFALVRGNRDRFQAAFDHLADRHLITHDQAGKTTGKGGRPTVRWFVAEVSDQSAGTEPNVDEVF